uniref:DUF1292 domain-containing protein n=1 Tax=Caenorhabditis tropicalis TaxID=1561998 RepID=A0A1I7TQX4_9PELO
MADNEQNLDQDEQEQPQPEQPPAGEIVPAERIEVIPDFVVETIFMNGLNGYGLMVELIGFNHGEQLLHLRYRLESGADNPQRAQRFREGIQGEIQLIGLRAEHAEHGGLDVEDNMLIQASDSGSDDEDIVFSSSSDEEMEVDDDDRDVSTSSDEIIVVDEE